VVADLQRLALEQPVGGLGLRGFDLETSSLDAEPEREASEALREAGGERDLALVVTHAAEAGDGGDPGPGEGGDVDAVASVVFQVM
jgi:ABC-type transport system involved in cytochrome bd biosynthesis fused ATPase/permease subunit